MSGDGRNPGEYTDPQSYSRIVTDLRVTDLRDAAHAWEKAAEGQSADAGREMAELALAVCDAYHSLPGSVTVSDAAALGALVRAAWGHQLIAWTDSKVPAGFTWGTVRGIVDERGNPADDSADLRDCLVRVTTSAGRDVRLPVAQAVTAAKAGVFVINYNQHPEAHGPGVWCRRCPDMTPPDPAVFHQVVAETGARKGIHGD